MSIGVLAAAGLYVLLNAQAHGDASALAPEDYPPPPATYDRAYAKQRAVDLSALGKQMFLDPSLSASGKQSCATCHSPAHDYGPPNDLAVQLGGADMTHHGRRAVPSLKYLQTVPAFIEHYVPGEDEGDDSTDQGPTGGLTWDGRSPTGRDQARIPLLDPDEMANTDPAAVVAKVKAAPYADTVRKLYGGHIFDDPAKAFAAITEALEDFEHTPAEFFPFTSKFDAFVLGKAKLTPQETHGMMLFSSADKGNCSSCHTFSGPKTLPVFNDFGLIALGVPRNPDIPANADPAYYDMGLCGPQRKDLSDHPEYCGLFRSPSLRNVATRTVFFHNGAFHSLRQVIEFYVQRDTNPEKWYPKKPDGTIDKFDDLPVRYRENVNMDPPFGGKPGDKPALDEAEIDDLIAFLQTLTDGYKPEDDTAGR
ncbi:cytochrome c peroxidase [Pigmentiphaga soli]|uniref:Cytochrome c peroxidase n=1 Tax=Pigmentiphaga soli TaxID=1007095 RepID=A0ABP8HQ87_9BURK